MALPKAYRLRYRRDFEAVHQRGLRRTSAHLILRALRLGKFAAGVSAADLPTCKIGISISRKVSKRAVDRNRIKRQIRAALRQLMPYLSPGWQVVIVVKASAIQCDYFQFLQELEQLLIQAEVLHGYS